MPGIVYETIRTAACIGCLTFSASAPAAVVYDNTGGGLGASVGLIGSLGGPPGLGQPAQALGELFTPTASGQLASVSVGLPFDYSATSASSAIFFVDLYTNNAGTLGTLLDGLQGLSTVPSPAGTLALTTATSTLNPYLDSTQSYWLVVLANPGNQLNWQGVAGAPNAPAVHFFTNAGGPGYYSGPQGSLVVSDLPSVPLPASRPLLLGALGALGLLSHGRCRRATLPTPAHPREVLRTD